MNLWVGRRCAAQVCGDLLPPSDIVKPPLALREPLELNYCRGMAEKGVNYTMRSQKYDDWFRFVANGRVLSR